MMKYWLNYAYHYKQYLIYYREARKAQLWLDLNKSLVNGDGGGGGAPNSILPPSMGMVWASAERKVYYYEKGERAAFQIMFHHHLLAYANLICW